MADLLAPGLFESVPFGVALMRPDYSIARANPRFERLFGEWRGRKCYDVCKNRSDPCDVCKARQVFATGQPQVADETGLDRQGALCHYVVHLMPLPDKDGGISHVLEVITDVTETRFFKRLHDILFERVPCYVTILDQDLRIVRANEKFRETFGTSQGGHCYQTYKRRDEPCEDCPAAMTFLDGVERVSTQVGINQKGEETHYIVTAAPLSRGPGEVAHVIEIASDITELKKLEKEKLDAERLAAVGQTVAGLAHTIKNMLMGLEGGMYMVDSGLKRNNSQRINQGWDMLQRNFNKTVSLVKDFLSFAKGRLPDLKPTDPNLLAGGIVELYRDAAAKQGVLLLLDASPEVSACPLDPDGVEACLTNLVSNAIDAAMTREDGRGQVTVRTRQDEEALTFEVEDNGCGLEWEVKQKVFTTFFTTKAGKGTGLGLLTTRKIVQEHGGAITVASETGAGAIFRIRLPLARLNEMAAAAERRRVTAPDDTGTGKG